MRTTRYQVEVPEDGYSYFECPLRTDLNSCAIGLRNKINHCPKAIDGKDDLFHFALPDDCPLKEGSVIITARESKDRTMDNKRRIVRKGFIIALRNGALGYDRYSYFTSDESSAEIILEDVRDEHPDMIVVPATLTFEIPRNDKGRVTND